MIEFSEKVVQFVETAVKMAGESASELMNEFLNYMIFANTFELIKNLLWLAALYLLFKFLNPLVIYYKSLGEKDPDAMRWYFIWVTTQKLIVVASLIGFVWLSHSSIQNIAKIIIAPKIYMLEEGGKILQNIKK